MLYVKGQMQSADWDVAPGYALCSVSACIKAESPAAADIISAGAVELSEIQYKVNMSKRDFYRIYLKVSGMVRKAVHNIRQVFAKRFSRIISRKLTANFKFTTVKRL